MYPTWKEAILYIVLGGSIGYCTLYVVKEGLRKAMDARIEKILRERADG